MTHIVVTRKLWYALDSEKVELDEGQLADKTEPLVILGEAGMGKTHLLQKLAESYDYAFCTAKQLINRVSPASLLGGAKVLVIDAIDEVSSRADGDAVDLVLRQLGVLGYPRFVLSCRAADWRSATGREAIQEQYDIAPLELHLGPFTDDDISSYLSESLGPELADAVITHFNSRGLNGLISNPQTLELVASVARVTTLPETRSELFEEAIDLLRVEHRNNRAQYEPAKESGLSAAGAAFAALILTGSDSIVRTATGNTGLGELQLVDVAQLPGAADISAMLGTRLFGARAADRFSYLHRRIGEFMGARWLAGLADTPRKRRRLLALFHGQMLVPASLRGIHAWLARDPALAHAVIAADPMGVVEYGDADDLTIEQARTLLGGLERLAIENPRFSGWGPYSMRGIAQEALTDDVRRIITSRETPIGLRVLVLRGITGGASVPKIVDDLRNLVHDREAVYATRSAAAEALLELKGGENWPTVLDALRSYGDTSSIRLALEILQQAGYENAEDQLIVDLVVAQASKDTRTVGPLFGIDSALPEARIPAILDIFAPAVLALGKPHERPGDNELTDFGFSLIARALSTGQVTSPQLWRWLTPFDGSVGFKSGARESIFQALKANDDLRRGVQRHVLLDLIGTENPWQRAFRLNRRSPALNPLPEDVVALLAVLQPSDQGDTRWKDLVQLITHDENSGVEVRDAARRFAAHDLALIAWLDGLANPPIPQWKLDEEKRRKKRKSERDRENAKARKFYSGELASLESGAADLVVRPAMAYLKLFSDIGDDIPAHERVAEWLGDEISQVAMRGFEAYLWLPPQHSADDIVQGIARRQYWETGSILVAAFAERLRKSVGFEDLPDERILAGYFEIRNRRLDRHAGIQDLDKAMELEIQRRGLWPEAMRLYHEPQLVAGLSHVDGLYSLMRDDPQGELGSSLASEWLVRFPELPETIETELADRLLRSGQLNTLRDLLPERLRSADATRRRNWEAIGLIVDFEATKAHLESSPFEPELLWSIRDKLGGRSPNLSGFVLSSLQLEWVVSVFRGLWPATGHPVGGFSGDTNPWDASDHIASLISHLGNDPSDGAVDAIGRLRAGAEDGYDYALAVVGAEQKRIRVEASYLPPSLAQVRALTSDRAPLSISDLQAFMIEELAIAQAKTKSDDAESWRGFFNDDLIPFHEERCRDHLLGLLRQGTADIVFEPESHVGDDKEVDITGSVGSLRLPIEIKGQWHVDLWTGADAQLDRLYAGDWRAEKRGIYLVLWFGGGQPPHKAIRTRGRGTTPPSTPEELRNLLIAGSRAAREGRITVVVFDLERP